MMAARMRMEPLEEEFEVEFLPEEDDEEEEEVLFILWHRENEQK